MHLSPFLALFGASSLVRRSDGNCTALPQGKGPVPSPDSASAFLNSNDIASLAKNAPTPSNYTVGFTNLHASSTADTYLGYVAMDSYDTNACAAMCNGKEGCLAINIFAERDPSLQVGADCPNPPSTTTIKCVFWGGAVMETNTNNTGYTDNAFEVVIAASNGYNNHTLGVTGSSSRAFTSPSASLWLVPLFAIML